MCTVRSSSLLLGGGGSASVHAGINPPQAWAWTHPPGSPPPTSPRLWAWTPHPGQIPQLSPGSGPRHPPARPSWAYTPPPSATLWTEWQTRVKHNLRKLRLRTVNMNLYLKKLTLVTYKLSSESFFSHLRFIYITRFRLRFLFPSIGTHWDKDRKLNQSRNRVM